MKSLKPIIAFLIIVSLISLTEWLSLRLGYEKDYIEFYLSNGSLIGLITAVVVISWGDLNKNLGLISTNPYVYLKTCCRVVSLPIVVMADGAKEISEKWDIITKGYKLGAVSFPLGDLWLFWDMLIGTFLMVLIILCLLVWLVLVAPLQYFVFPVSGAVSRLFALFLSERPIAILQDSELKIESISKDKKIPDGWWDASFSQKPVAFSAVISSLMLGILKMAI